MEDLSTHKTRLENLKALGKKNRPAAKRSQGPYGPRGPFLDFGAVSLDRRGWDRDSESAVRTTESLIDEAFGRFGDDGVGLD